MIRALLISGPPRSGKDTLAGRIAAPAGGVYDIVHAKVSLPLKQKAQAMFPAVPFCDEKWMLANKDKPHDALQQKTPRQFLIALSETFFKPLFGNDYFGQLQVELLKTLQDGCHIVYSDSGFEDETVPIVKLLGSENVIIVHLRRRGTDFTGDSRDYLNVRGLRSYGVQNTTLAYLDKVAAWAQRWLRYGQLGDVPAF